MKCRFSFIIPAYNSEKYIEKCIISIISQNIENYEIIVINDGSSDNTLSIVEKIKKEHSEIHIINQKNYGVSYSRNVGLKKAIGDYILFVDSDDFIEKDSLSDIEKIIQKYHNPDIIKFSYYLINKYNKKLYNYSVTRNAIIEKKDYIEKIYPHIIDTFDLSGVCSTLFSKKIIKNLYFNSKIKYGEDMLFMNQALKNSDTIVFSDITMYNYYENINSATNVIDYKKNIKQISDNLFVFNYINDLLGLNQESQIKNRLLELIDYKLILFTKYGYCDYKNKLMNLINDKKINEIINKKIYMKYKKYLVLKFKYIKHLIKYFFIK